MASGCNLLRHIKKGLQPKVATFFISFFGLLPVSLFVLNDLFTETTKGWSRDVNPPGIITMLVLFLTNHLLTEFIICEKRI